MFSIMYLFLAQWWKYNGEKLENKNGDWKYKNERWILPKPLTTEMKDEDKNEGHMMIDSVGSVLKADLDSKGMYALETFKH